MKLALGIVAFVYLWLLARYGLTPVELVKEILRQRRQHQERLAKSPPSEP